MALRITSKDYENLYVTSYFSFHGDKNTLYVTSSKQYRPTSGKLCPRTKHSTRENSLIFTREILTSTREKKSFCARENVRVPEKICAKVGEKNKFPPRKKLKKQRKNAFSGTFHFLGKKKHWTQALIKTDKNLQSLLLI